VAPPTARSIRGPAITRKNGARAGIEVLFDALEAAGRTFSSPTERTFERSAERGISGLFEWCEVRLACTPKLSPAELEALAARVAALVAR
jgi:hypothetical protein